MSGVIGRSWARVLQADLTVLLGALLAFVTVLAFLFIGNWIRGGPHALDESLLRAMRKPDDLTQPLGPPAVQEIARDITALGGYAVLTLLVGGILTYLLMNRYYHAALLIFCATVGGVLISTALKNIYDRPRPSVVKHLMDVSSASFPSGHSMLSAVVYLTLGALLARLSPKRRAKLFFVGAAVLLTLMVGASRVYLGVHYPTDVAGGWCAGVAWAVLCWLVARKLQRRGAVEQTVR